MKRILFSIVLIIFSLSVAKAVPAYPKPVKVTQPDGSVLTIQMHGDEYLHWATCGNSLVVKGSDGYYHYASFDADGSSKVQGGIVRSNLTGNGSAVMPPASAVAKAQDTRAKQTASAASDPDFPLSTGEKRFLILLIEFSDKQFTKEKQDFEDLLSSQNYTYNGATGSVLKYYNDVSFEQFAPVFDVYGPIQVSYTSAYCANDDSDAVIEACQYADEYLGVDFTKYCNANPSLVDNVFFFFPGYNQAENYDETCIWPHAVTYSYPFLYLDGVGIYKYGCTSEYKGSSGAVMAGIGTFCHEFGHVIGLPDFYDTDYNNNGSAAALDTYSLMSSGNYNNDGRTPPYLTYEEKNYLGWNDGPVKLVEGQNYLLPTSQNVSYYTPTSNEGEYFLYESRPCAGWDSYTGAGGLVIYHIDKSDYVMPNGYTAGQLWEKKKMINCYASHQCMDLVESKYPESSVYYYSEMVFPGKQNVTEFVPEPSSSSVPSFVDWSGSATGYNIHNISFDSQSGVTTFNITTEKYITGVVTNTSGDPVPGVEITIEAGESKIISATNSSDGCQLKTFEPTITKSGSSNYQVTTDETGSFRVDLPASGTYHVSASKEGYLPYSTVIDLDVNAELNIKLRTPEDVSSTTLQKYKTISEYSLGSNSTGYDFYGALKYTSAELAEYVGQDIKSVSFQVYSEEGSATEMGVNIYFDAEKVLSRALPEPVFNTIVTVDVADAKLAIPENRQVMFEYYVINPDDSYPLCLADVYEPVDGGNLYSIVTHGSTHSASWSATPYGNFVLSATLVDTEVMLDVNGINYIPVKSEYHSGDNITLKLRESTICPPSSVVWKVNGTEYADGTSLPLSAGEYIIRAFATYSSGRTEVIETKINVAY